MTDTIEEIRARHEAVERSQSYMNYIGDEAHADRATLLRALDEAQEELSIWQSVFPDIAPASVLPDRSKLEAELLERVKRYESMIRVLLENEPDDIVADGGHTVLDLWRHEARAALKETTDV